MFLETQMLLLELLLELLLLLLLLLLLPLFFLPLLQWLVRPWQQQEQQHLEKTIKKISWSGYASNLGD